MKHYTWTILFALTTACSPVKVGGNGGSDGGTNGSDGGTTSPDAGPGTVTALVLDQQLNPRPGVSVVFSTATGEIISSQISDANGMASETMYPGGMVSASNAIVNVDRVEYQVFTVMDVQPGDVIEFGPRTAVPNGNNLGTANFDFSSDWQGAHHYIVGTACRQLNVPAPSAGTQLPPWDFYDDGCSTMPKQYDLLAYAFPDSTETSVSAWADIGAIQPDPTNSYVDSGWSTNFNQLNVFFTQVPFDAQLQLGVQMSRNPAQYEAKGYARDTSASGGASAAYAVPIPTDFPDKILVNLKANSVAGDAFFAYSEMLGRTGNNVTLNGTMGYPTFDNVSVDRTDAARPAVKFHMTGDTPASAGGTIAFAIWGDPNPNGKESWQWIVVGPPGTASQMQAPFLPDDIVTDGTGQPRWPPPTTFDIVAVGAGEFELGDLSGWEAVRTKRGFGIVGTDAILSPGAAVGARSIISAGGLLPN